MGSSLALTHPVEQLPTVNQPQPTSPLLLSGECHRWQRGCGVIVACNKNKETKCGIQTPLILLSAAFILFPVLVTAHTLTVEAPAKETQVARGNNVTLRCQFKTEASIDSRDIVVWRKLNSVVNYNHVVNNSVVNCIKKHDRAQRRGGWEGRWKQESGWACVLGKKRFLQDSP